VIPLLNVKKLREIRERSGLSQTELARKVGVTPSQISNIETSKRGLSTETLAAILQVLGIKIEDIWNSEDGDIPILPVTDRGIVVEKTRFVLPPTAETYQMIVSQITGRLDVDPNLLNIVEKWNTTPKENQDKILEIINIQDSQ
jgi:transcriptional regulator with XRE-family HTH domain